MKKQLILFLAAFSVTLYGSAQKHCHSTEKNTQLLLTNEAFRTDQTSLEEFTKNYVKTYQSKLANSNNKSAAKLINVVVHILYDQESENFTDAQVQEVIDSLNNDFRGLNHDGSFNPSSVFFDLWADTEIQFQLAKKDTNGNATTGITRTETSVTNFSANTENMKYTAEGGADNWDPHKFLNIWVCTYGSPQDLGFAYYPSVLNADPDIDGVVINTPAFAISGNRLGRTLTHEIGHYLNLRHIWGDAECGDDLVDDTPPHYLENYGCPTYPHTVNDSCSVANNDEGEMFMNYMDYTDDDCMTMFTLNQSARMNATLEDVRFELWTEINSVESLFDDKLSIYPNPAENQIYIKGEFERVGKVVIVNSIGEKFVSNYIQSGGNLIIDVNSLILGVYSLIIQSKQQVYTSRFIKQ